MGMFSAKPKTDVELIAARDDGLARMKDPKVAGLDTTGNILIGGLVTALALLSKSSAKVLSTEGGLVAKSMKAVTSTPGAIVAGVASAVGLQQLSRYSAKLDGEIAVNNANADLKPVVGRELGLAPITLDDVQRMREAKEHGSMVLGNQTARAVQSKQVQAPGAGVIPQ